MTEKKRTGKRWTRGEKKRKYKRGEIGGDKKRRINLQVETKKGHQRCRKVDIRRGERTEEVRN